MIKIELMYWHNLIKTAEDLAENQPIQAQGKAYGNINYCKFFFFFRLWFKIGNAGKL